QAEDGIRDFHVTGVQTCALPIFTLAPEAMTLEGITVNAPRPPPGNAQAGEQSTSLPQELLSRLPLPDLDPATLALLAAGVVGTEIGRASCREREEHGGLAGALTT